MALTPRDVSQLKNKVYDQRDQATNLMTEKKDIETVEKIVNDISNIQLKYTGEEIIARMKENINTTANAIYAYVSNPKAIRHSEKQVGIGKVNLRIWEETIAHIDPEMIYWITPSEAMDLHLIDLSKKSKAEEDFEKLEQLQKESVN